jgi:hypothetical protein
VRSGFRPSLLFRLLRHGVGKNETSLNNHHNGAGIGRPEIIWQFLRLFLRSRVSPNYHPRSGLDRRPDHDVGQDPPRKLGSLERFKVCRRLRRRRVVRLSVPIEFPRNFISFTSPHFNL